MQDFVHRPFGLSNQGRSASLQPFTKEVLEGYQKKPYITPSQNPIKALKHICNIGNIGASIITNTIVWRGSLLEL